MADISLQYLDQPLNNISVDYHNDAFYAEKLFPIVPVQKQTGRYWVYGKEEFRRYETIRHNKSEAREIAPYSITNNNYYCDDHALKDSISDEDVANNATGNSLDVKVVNNLNKAILLDFECRAASSVVASVSGSALSGTTMWDNPSSNPISAIESARFTIKKNVAKTANTLAVSFPVHQALRQHPLIIDRFKYTTLPNGFVNEQQLASVFEVQNYWVMGAEQNLANEGQPANLDFIWTNMALLAYVLDEPTLLDVTLGYTFRWLFGAPELGGVLTKRYREEKKCSDVVEVHRYDDLEFVSSQSGYLFTNCTVAS